MNTQITCKSASQNSEANSTYIQPKFTVEKSENETRVFVELPGVSKDKLNLSVENRQIFLQTEGSAKRTESWEVLHRESKDQSFQLRLNLGQQVDQAAIEANLQDGMLTLTLPKAEAAKPQWNKLIFAIYTRPEAILPPAFSYLEARNNIQLNCLIPIVGNKP
jgi:HSP20 family protein